MSTSFAAKNLPSLPEASVQARGHQSIWKRFLSYYAPQKHLLIADLICALIIAAIDLSYPQILRGLINSLFQGSAAEIYKALWIVCLGLAGLYALRVVCRYFVAAWGHIMGLRMEARMREDLFDMYQRFSFTYYDQHNTGDLMSRLISDLFDISEAAHHGPENLLISGLEIVGSFILLSLINWKLALALFIITAIMAAILFVQNRAMKSTFMENRKKISAVNSRLQDSLAGIHVTKSFANEHVERAKFRKSNDDYSASKTNTYQTMGRYMATSAGMFGLLYVTIILLGGLLIAQGEMLASDLAIFALYIGIFMSPIEVLINFAEVFQKASAGFKRFVEVLDTTPDIVDKNGATALQLKEGHVEFKNVNFSYDGKERVIKDLNLNLEPGKTYALVGPSGGGKSTTCSLLLRFYEIDGGSICIDGQDIREVTQKSLREALGLVQQDVYLFDGTLRENIAYGRPDATEEEIHEAARKAHIDKFIDSLPDGFDTQVGERGTRLSGGQKQRVAIARIFLRDPKVLILDEATSALDNESERFVQQSLTELAKGRTTIIIAHRLSTIVNADEIISIQDGRVAEQGSHAELMKRNGIYASYYRMQFGTEQA